LNNLKLLAALICSLLAFSFRATADTWTELGNAGQLVGTAQITVGNPSNALTDIFGTFSAGNDIDLYKIFISDPVNFSASTSSGKNTELFLFSNTGIGVMFNDDRINPPTSLANEQALLPTAGGRPLGVGPFTAGNYYLGISQFDNDPSSAGGAIFPAGNGQPVVGPTGPGGGSPLTGWTNTFPAASGGAYTITLTGAKFATPEPGSLALYGIGTLGLITLFRWKRRNLAA
jgi:hypothetical protein